MTGDGIARLSVDGKYSFFSLGDECIRFRTSDQLCKYIKIKEWDDGYIVVDVDYQTLGVVEDYIDLNAILDDLYVDKEVFLKPVKEVVVSC